MFLSVSSSNLFRSTLKPRLPRCKGKTAYSTEDTTTSTHTCAPTRTVRVIPVPVPVDYRTVLVVPLLYRNATCTHEVRIPSNLTVD